MRKEDVIIILAGVLWGFVGVITTQLLKLKFSAFAIVEFRFLFSAIITMVLLLIFNKKALKPKDFKLYFIIGLSTFLTCAFYYLAIEQLGGAFACSLLYTAPIFLSIYNCIKNKEPLSVNLIVSIILVLLGCGLSGKSGVTFSFKGVVFGILSALFNSFASIFGAKVKKENKIGANFYAFLSASIVGLIFLRANVFANLIDFKVSILFLLLSTACTILPYILYVGAIKQGQEARASLFCASEPITANLIDIILYKRINVFSVFSITCLILGVVVLSLNNSVLSLIIKKNNKRRKLS